mmetsp:Transcript_54638/g.70250  ORF Transcript_54638/g.70250 Transcript_54638/m.70250 type:complete len:694 (+) Transcript_54638:39-2120(+)
MEYQEDHRSLFGPGEWNQKELGPGPIPDPPDTAYGLAVVFGIAMVAHVMFCAAAAFDGKPSPCTDLLSAKHSIPIDISSLPSVHALLRELSRFGFVLSLCWVAEHHPPYPHLSKIYDRDLYWAVTAQLFLVAIFTLRTVPKNGTEILGREQTEEWKGWMQFSFLMYHYFNAEDTYNAIRVMITCYVWMTGFGNFSFFYIKRDFGTVRLLQMMWRLNFLVVFLCMLFGNTYILYYICPLHTCFFLMVYVTMRIKNDVNHTQWGVRLKLALVGLLIYLIWDLKESNLYNLIFSWWMNDIKTIGATLGPRWEWYFRSSLDHWSTFLGMIFALNYPAAKHWMLVVEGLPAHQSGLIKTAATLPILGALYWWYTGVFQYEKPVYNSTNAYFGCIPLLGYIFLRNLTPTLRGSYSHALHELGKVTLETYLLQHHLWLSSNAKSLLRLIPFEEWRACNMLVTTTVYFFASRELYRLTMSLRGMILPDSSAKDCIRNLIVFCGTLILSWGIGALLNHMVETQAEAAPLIFGLSLAFGTVLFIAIKMQHNGAQQKSSQFAVVFTIGLSFVAYAVLYQYFTSGTRVLEGDVFTPKFPIPKLAQKIPGEMANPMLGLGILGVSMVMLFSMDSYFGFPMLALKMFGGEGVNVTYADAYQPLLDSIGVGSGLPSSAPSSTPTVALPTTDEPSDKDDAPLLRTSSGD